LGFSLTMFELPVTMWTTIVLSRPRRRRQPWPHSTDQFPIWCATNLQRPSTRFRDAIRAKLAVQYLVGAFMAVMTWWLDGGRSCRRSASMRCFGVWRLRGSRRHVPEGTFRRSRFVESAQLATGDAIVDLPS